MSIFDRFKSKTVEVENKVVKKKTNQAESHLHEQQKYRQAEDIKTLEDAILEAENIETPQRYNLNRIFDRIEQDPHFVSQWTTRKMKTIQREFGLYRGDSEEKDKATELFESDWFHKFANLALDSMTRGYIVLTFGDWVDDSFAWSRGKDLRMYEPVRKINYDHVIPERGLLKQNNYDTPGGATFDLLKAPLSNQTLFIGSPTDFGLLFKCAKYILFKDNCLSNWSEFAEVFGHDIRVGKTDSQGAKRTAFYNMLKSLGSGGFGIMDEDDSLEFAGTSRTDAFKVYKELNEYVDKNVSMLIFGQDVIGTMTGKTTGTAAENIADLYGDHDAKFLAGIINNQLMPFLEKIGVPVGGLRFEWDTTQSMTLTEQADIDLKISQMGKVLDEEYLSEKYGATFQEVDANDQTSADLPQIFEYHIENGIVNKNEVRERLGFAPDNTIDKEEEDAEIARKVGLMKESRAAGIPLDEAARLAGFDESEVKKMVDSAKAAEPAPKIQEPEKVAKALKNLYGGK